MPLIRLWISCSALFLAACASLPDTDLCVVNAPAGYQRCYNLERDYRPDGTRKPEAKPHFKPAASVTDLNANICTDPDGFANLKAFLKNVRGVKTP